MIYYTCANTSAGFWDLTMDNTFDAEKVIKLNCSNKYITDTILKELCRIISDSAEKIIYPGSVNLFSGVIDRKQKLAIVSAIEDSSCNVNVDEILGIKPCTEFKMPIPMEIAYSEAKKIHDDWEKIYIENMDFAKLDSYCENIISTIVKGESTNGNTKVYKRFFGTTTSRGTVNFIDELTLGLNKRYFIKGRPGTGKSTFLKKLSSALTKNGFDIEQYYCSFDPMSLDMVVSRELSFCVFDSTAPHEKFPEREWDVILDFYEESGLGGIDEKYEKELANIKNAYREKIEEGNKALKEALIHDNNIKLTVFNKVRKEDIAEVVKRICEEV